MYDKSKETVTKYFRKVLSVIPNKAIDFKKDNFFEISMKEFKEGIVNPEIYYNFEKNQKVKGSLDIIIAAKTIKSNYDSTKRLNYKIDELTSIFFVPATLKIDGTLEYNQQKGMLPWIPREYLTPMIEPQISIGTTKAYDEYLSNTVSKRLTIDSWGGYVNYAKELYETVTKSEFDTDFVWQGNTKLPLEDKLYAFLDTSLNATIGLLRLYDQIILDHAKLPLYQKFTQLSCEPLEDRIPTDSAENLKAHSGQMGGEYELSFSQRESLCHYTIMKTGEILAVNGPPGTGKTTLLQTIVANQFVENALKEEKAPIIVASSTNNQAVTNIIDSFGNIKPTGFTNLEERWICGVDSFAVYFPALGKLNEAKMKGYQYTSIRGDNFVEMVDNCKNIDESTIKMLDMCYFYFEKSFLSIKECKNFIHKQLTQIEQIKRKIIDIVTELKRKLGQETLREKKAKTEKKIDAIEEEIHLHLCAIEEENKIIANYRKRMNEWNKKYATLPRHWVCLKFLNYFRRKIASELRAFKEAKEYEYLPDEYTLSAILETYSIYIEKHNKSILKLQRELEEKKEALLKEKEELKDLFTYTTAYKREFEHLKEFKIDIYHNINEINKPNSKEQFQESIDYFDEFVINKILDTKIRYVEFWLAVHYYECRWIEKENFISKAQRQQLLKNNSFENILDSFYHRLAMITPCMVMTFFVLPSQFRAKNNINFKDFYYLYNYIDLLIVDEAGQVSPEIGAAAFALAKKAFVVGDEKQIPPVWGIEKAVDVALAMESGLIEDTEEYNLLEQFGLSCASSSIMKAARKSCKYSKFNNRGLFLSEHRRCYNEIISYCNELVYNGNLEPLRGYGKEDHSYPIQLPHMGYYDIPVTKSKVSGCSRVNPTEANIIVEWITKNYKTLFQSYKKKTNILGVITPFKAQADLIKQLLKLASPEIANDIAIGTVHTFQGAERNIILLSTVYGYQEKCTFIDSNDSLMNVAVSRAKDSFLLFGALGCLKEDSFSVSGLLRKHLIEEVK